MTAAATEYYRQHAACPECGSEKFSSTYMGYCVDLPLAQDKNRIRCGCGWKGIRHDLKQAGLNDET